MLAKRILLVDDDADLSVLFKEVFTAEGYEVFCTENPLKALEWVRESIFPVIFVDINLTFMNGTVLCKKIRRLSRRSFIIAWTGDSSFRREECLDAGFNELLYKPISISRLTAIANASFNLFQADKEGKLPLSAPSREDVDDLS